MSSIVSDVTDRRHQNSGSYAHISIIIPNRNKGATLGRCLKAAFSSEYENFEVIVVDDCSSDDSVEIAKQFPCKLIQLDKHSGASKARNAGAGSSKGDILFFIDADCLLQKDTLAAANEAMAGCLDGFAIVGGTYTKIPFDDSFFGTFQSVFVNYFESKRNKPDYVATHAMAISANHFKSTGGFREQFLPILEDVEFSHRLRRDGYELVIDPKILVQHVFNFSLVKSLYNAFYKSMYWTIYSIRSGDLFADSGTASTELKVNGISFLLCVFTLHLSLTPAGLLYIPFILLAFIFNLAINKGLLAEFYKINGISFAVLATAYYTMLYPAAVLAGAAAGIVRYPRYRKL